MTENTPKKRRWLGDPPGECDLKTHIKGPHGDTKQAFVDGATSFGAWANMCLKCHRAYGKGLGLGKGQQYELGADGYMWKTGG